MNILIEIETKDDAGSGDTRFLSFLKKKFFGDDYALSTI